MEKRGRFYVFEGIDGSGKSTQAKLFAYKLFDSSKFNHVVLTREPWNSQEIRRRLTEEHDAYSNAEKMFKLYFEDRKEHHKVLILPNLSQGIHIVSDRERLSTLAYQSTQGLDMDTLIAKHKELLVPDITFFIDVPVEVAIERMKNQADGREKKFESNKQFQEQLKNNYFKAISRLRENAERIYIINGNRSPDKVAEEIWSLED